MTKEGKVIVALNDRLLTQSDVADRGMVAGCKPKTIQLISLPKSWTRNTIWKRQGVIDIEFRVMTKTERIR